MKTGDIITLLRRNGRHPARVIKTNGDGNTVIRFMSPQMKKWTIYTAMPASLQTSTVAEKSRLITLEADYPDFDDLEAAKKKIAHPARLVAAAPVADKNNLAEILNRKIVFYGSRVSPCRIIRAGLGPLVYVQILIDKRWTILCVSKLALFVASSKEHAALIIAEYTYPMSDERYCREPMRRFMAGESFFQEEIIA